VAPSARFELCAAVGRASIAEMPSAITY